MAKFDFQLQELSPDDWKSWDSFVRNSPQGTVFQSTPYINAYSTAFDRKIEILTVIENAEIIAGMVLLPKKRGTLVYSTAPYLIPFNGILFRNDASFNSYLKKVKFQQRILELIQQELETRFHFCEIYLAPTIVDIRSLIWNKWQILPDYTIFIPLGDQNKPLATFPHNQRRHIRKFEKSTFLFEQSSDINRCYSLMSQSYQHHGLKPPIEQQDFEKFVSILLKKNLLKTYIISIDNRPASFLMVIEDKPKVYALFSGKDFNQERSEAELYLHWRLLQLYREQSYDSFDLLGAMSRSISRVKLELGGQLVRQDIARFYKNGFIRFLLQVKEFRQMRTRRIF